MTAVCKRCGQAWARDPALEVPCPHCGAAIGSPCKRPSGHGCELHPDRDRAALAAGIYQPCVGTATPERDLFGEAVAPVPSGPVQSSLFDALAGTALAQREHRKLARKDRSITADEIVRDLKDTP